MGPITTAPHKFGLNVSQEEIGNYVYFWKCVGHQLGIRDEFNLCSLGIDQSTNIVHEITQEIVLPDIAEPPKEYHPIAKAFIDGTNLMFPPQFPLFSITATLAFIYSTLDEPVVMPLDGADRARFWILKYAVDMLGAFPGLERLASWLLVKLFGMLPSMQLSELGCPYRRMATAHQKAQQSATASPTTAEHVHHDHDHTKGSTRSEDTTASASVASIQLRVALMLWVLNLYIICVCLLGLAVVALLAYFIVAPLVCHCLWMYHGSVSPQLNTTPTSLPSSRFSFCGCSYTDV